MAPTRRDSLEGSQATMMTDQSDGAAMMQTMKAMEQLVGEKKRKRTQKMGDLHANLMNKVKTTLEDIADTSLEARNQHMQQLKQRVKIIKDTSEELADVEKDLNEKYTEMGDCVKILEDMSVQRESLGRKRSAVEMEHREEKVAKFRKLKHDIEGVLSQCMTALQKVCRGGGGCFTSASSSFF